MIRIPYGRQTVDEEDIAAVLEVLRGDWLTTGPAVDGFEQDLREMLGCRTAVVCSSGTAALHIAHLALGLGAGDRVVVPSLTFTASAAAAHLTGAEVTLADVDPESGLMTTETFWRAAELDGNEKPPAATVAVHLNGQCVDLPGLSEAASQLGCRIIEDACHAIGSSYGEDEERGAVGACLHSDLACFSFHPVKTITTGEGGAVTAAEENMGETLRLFRSHGIERDRGRLTDHEGGRQPWYYETVSLSTNYRLSDLHAALGRSQLRKIRTFKGRRQELVECYDELLRPFAPGIRPVRRMANSRPAWHLYSVLIDFAAFRRSRAEVMDHMRARGIGTQVHYIPLHLQPYYRRRYGDVKLPGAETYYGKQLSLPLYPELREAQVEEVIRALAEALGV